MAEGGQEALPTSEILNEDDPPKEIISSLAIEQVSKGILDLSKPEITNMHNKVKEVLRNQGVVRDSTQNELTQLRECAMLADVVKTFEKAKIYQKKLMQIKKDMNNLSDRTEKAKIKAERLRLQKEKDELAIAQEKERQRKYESELTAKPAAEYSLKTN